MRLYEVFYKPAGPEWHKRWFIGLFAAQGEQWACEEAINEKFGGNLPTGFTIYANLWNGEKAPSDHLDPW